MKLPTTLLLISLTSAPFCFAADVPAPATRPTTRPLTKTVGIDIVKKTVNPDGTWTLLFEWKNKENQMESRSVIVNQSTVIGVDGQLKTMADITDSVLKKKVVATVGPDMVTAVNLRFGRAMVQVTKDQLTPEQIKQLESAAPVATEASNAALNKRVDALVGSLQLNDAAKESRVKEILATNLRAVRDSHNAGFAPEKSVRDNFNAGLKAELTPDQIEAVKNKLTVNKVPITFGVYHQIITNLTPEEDAKILDRLKAAREDCLNVKNPDEMGRVFEPYKKEIENYLIANGHDWKTLYKQFVDAQRAGATTRPAN